MARNNTHDDNSESPIIVWFDTKAFDEENKMTREFLQETIGKLMPFNNKTKYRRFFGRDLCIKRSVHNHQRSTW